MRKSADFGAGACLFGALLSVVTGCASLGPAEQRRARAVLHTERFVQERQVERLSLKAPAVWATAERVSANVEQTWMCRGAYREKVSTTTITSHPTKNVGAETMVGLALAGAGGVALGISPGLSDVKPNPSDASPREEAQILGGLGLGTGVILVGHALWVAVAAAEHESDAVVTEEVRAPEREMKECGRDVAGAGVVVARVGERELELTEVPSGAVDVYLRAHREELCGDPNSGHLFAKLSFVMSSKERLAVPLGAYPLKQCVMATTARRKLRLAETQLASEVDGRRVAQAVNLVDDADELVEGLSRSDPEKGDLQLEVARLRTVVASKSVGVLAALVDQSVAKIDAGAEDAASSALAALDVARVSKAEAATRRALYGAFGRQGAVRGYAGLAALVERDRGAKACLQHGEGCSDELPRERWLELLEPLARSVAAATQQSSLKLEAATKELSKSRTGTTLAAFDAATEQAKAAGARCQLPLGAVEAACAHLKEAERAAESFAMGQSFELQQLRQRIAEKQRAEQLKKTATRWRRHFAECARLEHGERALQAVGHCDSACEAVVSRMDAERLKLRAFEYSEVVDDASLGSTLREECLAAGCERCP